MKAILRSINNFSCKLKQSNNLKYNISPKIRSNKFKSISGNGNVVIDDALNKDLKDYRVYGNTYQNSTKGINIYNVHNTKVNVSNEVEILSNDYVSCTYDNTNGSTIHYSNFMIAKTPQLQLSTNYLVVCEIQSVSGTGSLYPFTKHANSCINTQHTLYRFSDLSKGQKLLIPVTTVSSFTGASSDLRSLIRFDAGQSGSITFRLSLLTDTTITSDTFEYEPYTGGQPSPNPDYPQEILSCGDLITDSQDENYGKYKIPVNVRSENLFDKDNANVLSAYFGIADNKDVITSTSNNRMIYIPCKPNTTYTILKSLSNQFSIGYTYAQPEARVSVYGMLEGTKSSVRNDDINTIVHLSITTNENAKYLVLRYTNTNNDTNSTWQEKLNVIQIVEGTTTPTKYQPYYNETTNIYLDEPLRGIGEYSDYIDFVNGKVVRNIKEIVLDGSEDWYTSSGTSQVAFNKGVGYIHDTTKLPCNISINCQMPNNNLYFYSTGYSLADWKTFLSTTNAIVYGRLLTPTEEDIELPNINLIEGKNIITIGTEVQGIFEVEYYSKEIIDISDYKYNLRKVED